MPYDASLPVNGAKVKAAELRGQFAGLKELIDAGTGITSVTVDAVTTLPPGEPAMVQLGITGSVLHLSFALPQGQPGPPGLQGPPFANVVIDSITTLAPGEHASVTVSFDGTLVHLSFAIPQGATGEQGAPGEVTNATLASAMADTARNPIGLGPFTGTFSDPVTPAEMQAFAAYVESFRAALAR